MKKSAPKISVRVGFMIRVRVRITVLDYIIQMAEMIICTGRYPHFSIDHNEKDSGVYILPKCIKSKWPNKDDKKSPNDQKF